MKCIIHCPDSASKKMQEYFPDISTYILKIANKPLIEYYIDFCVLLGIKEIRIVMDEPSSDVEKFFREGPQWGVKISYGISSETDKFEDLIQKNNAFIGKSSVLLINGLFFIEYDKRKKDYKSLGSSEKSFVLECDAGTLTYLNSKSVAGKNYDVEKSESAEKELKLRPLDSLKLFYDLNMEIIYNGSKKYYTHGYSNEDGVNIGQNVEIAKSCKLSKAVNIGNNVSFKSMTQIGPSAIVGTNVLIDSKTVVENSIIYDNSFIGSGLEIKDKIVYHNHLMDPESGELIDIVDQFLISEVKTGLGERLFTYMIQSLTALMMFIVLLPFYLLFRIILAPLLKKTDETKYIIRKGGDTENLKIRERQYGFPVSLFFKINLDKIPLIFHIIRGKMYLVGNTLVEDSEEGRNLLKDMPVYRPSLFSYSDMVSGEDAEYFEKTINDLYYSNNHNFMFDVSIFIKSLFKRLFS